MSVFMNKKKNTASIDGFIPRRPGSELGSLHNQKNVENAVEPIDRSLHTGDNESAIPLGVAREGKELGRDDISASLNEIDDPKESKKQRRRDKKRDKAKKPKSKVKRIILIIVAVLLLGVLGVGAYVGYKLFVAGNNVFEGSIIDIIQPPQRLKEDENGRSNFVVFGTAEDDEGGEHGGANLTDSIMVLSIDQDEKNAYVLSLPRDLWVSYEMPNGEICPVGYQGKINAQYFCASNNGEDEAAGAEALADKVGEVTGLDIQYYAHINFTVVVEAIDAIGGIDVTIESSDPRGILDRNFDWKCNYTCYYVNYKNGETVHLDGEHALALSRARNASGGYGLPNGNFDREKNQQLIGRAALDKAVSAGTLTNLGAVTGLIDALGSNLRTNVATKEIRTIMDLAQSFEQERIYSLSLVEEGNMLVTTGSYNGQSIVRPIAGLLDFSDIVDYVQENVTSDEVDREAPHVTILNGSGVSGAATTEATELEDQGFIVDVTDNAPTSDYTSTYIYVIDETKVASLDRLKEMYGTYEVLESQPPVSVVGETDFLIILGSGE